MNCCYNTTWTGFGSSELIAMRGLPNRAATQARPALEIGARGASPCHSHGCSHELWNT